MDVQHTATAQRDTLTSNLSSLPTRVSWGRSELQLFACSVQYFFVLQVYAKCAKHAPFAHFEPKPAIDFGDDTCLGQPCTQHYESECGVPVTRNTVLHMIRCLASSPEHFVEHNLDILPPQHLNTVLHVNGAFRHTTTFYTMCVLNCRIGC